MLYAVLKMDNIMSDFKFFSLIRNYLFVILFGKEVLDNCILFLKDWYIYD